MYLGVLEFVSEVQYRMFDDFLQPFANIHITWEKGIVKFLLKISSFVMRLWAGRSGFRILAGTRDLSLLQNIRTGSGAT
jgi:hypothetical protein